MLSRIKGLRAMVAGVGGLILAITLSAAGGQAETDSRWLPPADLNLQRQPGLTTAPPALNGNVDCYLEPDSRCIIETSYGSASGSTVRLANSADYLPVISYVDGRQHFIPIPDSSGFISYTTEPVYGLYLYFNYGFTNSVVLTKDGYRVSRPPDGRLQDGSGQRLAADFSSISFSANGRWMIASVPNVAMVRVDLQSLTVLPFAPGFDYSLGLGPFPETSITNDGRYAAVASSNFGRFTVYDLATCGGAPSVITGPVSCQSRDLFKIASQQIPGFNGAWNLRFLSDDTLSLYSTGTKYLLVSGDIPHQQDYLALGDSYISGEGAFSYLPGTDTADNQCHLSSVSYPYLLGYDLGYNSYRSVACSGATSNDVINTNTKYTGQAQPYTAQGDFAERQVESILANFSPGYIDQLDFVRRYQPRRLTISIGGNDIGFSDKLRACLAPGTCFGSYEDRLEFVDEVNRAFPKFVSVYSKLKTGGPPDALIYVVGYPQIAKPDGNCAVNVLMNNNELVFAQQAIDYLNAVIHAAATKAGVFYVDAQNVFYGHRLCEAAPGSVAMNGITAGNDFPDFLGGPIGRESYHPNAFGHQLIENLVQDLTNDLTQGMPLPQTGTRPPAEAGLEILNAPRSGRTTNVTEYDTNISADTASKNAAFDISVRGEPHGLAPGSSLHAELHSSAAELGNFTTDDSGNLTAQVVIPPFVPDGYHTLHLYGTDIASQPIDIYKTVYITAAASGEQTSVSGSLPRPGTSASLSLESNESGPGATGVTVQAGRAAGPAVLGISTALKPTDNRTAVDANLKVPGWFYPVAGFGFLALVSFSYCFKKWL